MPSVYSMVASAVTKPMAPHYEAWIEAYPEVEGKFTFNSDFRTLPPEVEYSDYR